MRYYVRRASRWRGPLTVGVVAVVLTLLAVVGSVVYAIVATFVP